MSDSDSEEPKAKKLLSDDEAEQMPEEGVEGAQAAPVTTEVVPDVSDSDDGIDDNIGRG